MKIDKIYSTSSVYPLSKLKQVSTPSFKGISETSVDNLIEQRENAISVKSQAESTVSYADNFNRNVYRRQIEAKMQREIEEKGLNRFRKILSSEHGNIVEKWDNIFNDELVKVRYIKTNRDFYINVIKQSTALIAKLDVEIEKLTGLTIDEVLAPLQVKPEKPISSSPAAGTKTRPVPPPPPYIPNVNGKQANSKPQPKITQTIEDLRRLEDSWSSLSDSDPEKPELGRKISNLEEKLKNNNISFVSKPPANFANEDEKIAYIQCALLEADVNEASAMDALSVFEKYGSRYTYGPNNSKNIRTGISDLALAIDKISGSFDGEIADRAISKYLDLFNKFARSDGEYTDTRHLRLLIERHHSKMSEDTVMKMIDILKKFSFEKAQAWSVRRYILDDAYTTRTPEELSRIEENLKELEEIVKDMPMKDKSKT